MSRPVSASALVSALLAPLALIVGCAWAAAQQPGFDSTRDTISALAGLGARDRWIMTGAFWVLGLCHVVTALGLRAARWPGRALLGWGGLSIIGVALVPVPAHGESHAHAQVAMSAFVSMCAWPLLALRTDALAPLLRARASIAASVGLFVLLSLFGLAVWGDLGVGLSERVVAIAQSLWPLAVALSVRKTARAPDPYAARP